MVTISCTLDLPEDLIERLGSREGLAVRARQALILQLLRESEISQGLAAEMLGITRWEMLQLMARDHIYSGPESAEEATQDVEAARIGRLTPASRASG
jgi:predicted HTH domain antitoxin